MATDFIDVWELARRRDEVRGDMPLRRLPRLADALADFSGDLHFRLAGHVDDHGRAAATLWLGSVVKARCDRCGGAVDVPVKERETFFFVNDEAELARLPIDESGEEPLLGSRRFDLVALLEDQMILALPISPRHRNCTAPANVSDEVASAGDDSESRRPFAALAALKRRKK